MPVEFDVEYSLQGRRGRTPGKAQDLSTGGLRLLCDEDFLAGSVLLLDFRLPEAFLNAMAHEKEVYEQSPFGLRPETVKVQPPGFPPMSIRARVLSSFFSAQDRRFSHGLEFLDADGKTEDQLQRFINLVQVDRLRSRNGG